MVSAGARIVCPLVWVVGRGGILPSNRRQSACWLWDAAPGGSASNPPITNRSPAMSGSGLTTFCHVSSDWAGSKRILCWHRVSSACHRTARWPTRSARPQLVGGRCPACARNARAAGWRVPAPLTNSIGYRGLSHTPWADPLASSRSRHLRRSPRRRASPEECPLVPVIALCPFKSQRERVQVSLVERQQHFVVSRAKQRPVGQARVLKPLRPTPSAEIGILLIGQREDGSVEFHPGVASCAAGHKVALQGVTARHCGVLRPIHSDPTPIPELVPPLPMRLAGGLDVEPADSADVLGKGRQPLIARAGLQRQDVNLDHMASARIG